MADTSRAETLVNEAARWPSGEHVVKLARAVSLAVLVEPGLLRRARIHLVAGADAGTESDLWFSPLVLTRNVTGIVLDPEVLTVLRRQLAGGVHPEADDQEAVDPDFADRARDLVARLHAGHPPAVQLEEEVIWEAVRHGKAAQSQIEERLRTAVKAMATDPDGGRDVARWAAQAWWRLPETVTETDAAHLLAVGAALRLGTAAGVATFSKQMPASVGWLMPGSSSTPTLLGVELAADGLRFAEPGANGLALELPSTSPLVLEIGWSDGASSHREVKVVAPGTDIVLGSLVGPVTLRTLAGQRYIIEPEIVPAASTQAGQIGEQRPEVAGPVLRLAPRPPLLAGREELLAELDDRLAGREGAGPRVVALHGLSGVGKTSVAVDYAYRHLGEVGVAWQLAAEDATVLAAGFAELAAQLGEGWAGGGGDPVAGVHSALAARPGQWLLIFDNVPSPETVQGLVPPGGNGRVLITSRSALWPPGQAVEVPVLGVEVAAGFLTARTGDADRQAAVGLAEAMGGLPLALEQAAAYIQATGNSLAAYLALFHKRRADLLARGEPTGYPQTVAAAWSLTFDQLEHSDPGAAGLLRLLAFYAPEAVPLRLLLAPQPGLAERLDPEVAGVLAPLLDDELAAGDALAALRRYSLVRPAGDGAVSVHRLVQAVTADQMPGDLAGAWRQAAASLIEAALPDDPRQPATWPVYAALLPHAQAVLDLTSDGLWRIALYLGFSGSYPAARDLFRVIADAHTENDAYGPEHRDTLAARAQLAFWTGQAGDAATARDQFAALLPIRERVSGPEHPDTLTVRNNLARWTGTAGDTAGARDQIAALLPIQERVLGPEHPDTLTVRGNLARWTGTAGDAATARDQFAALLPILERVSGPEHPETLSARNGLAYWTGAAGDPSGAHDQLAALLPIQERVLGPEHPDTLTTRGNLARWTGTAGDASGARDQLAALLPIQERVLGPEHPDTLTTRGNLAYWTRQAEGEDEAG